MPPTSNDPKPIADATNPWFMNYTPEELKSKPVTYLDKPAVITLSHPDATADIQLVDETGRALLDEQKQPRWYPRVPLADVKER